MKVLKFGPFGTDKLGMNKPTEERRKNTERRTTISDLGDQMESRSYLAVTKLVNRLLTSFFHFKKRKGEIVAGSATFFTVLSFAPLILLLISAAGMIHGDVGAARDFALTSLKENIPGLAPWILKSFSNIINAQLKSSAGFNFMNSLLVVYACLGVVGSMMFGLRQISKSEAKGGFYIEDIKGLFTGVLVAGFISLLMAFSHKPMMIKMFASGDIAFLNSIAKFIINFNVLPAVTSLAFFTGFYKFATPVKVATKDAFMGASTFVGCFLMGKSFYWMYLLYAKDTLSQSYGNFYTIFVAVFWVYFLMCSFFYGAAVCYGKNRDVYSGMKIGVKPTGEVAAMPPVPGEDKRAA